MVVEFLCPNGHRIHCGEDQVGKAARCPRCGVRFRVPQPSEVDLPESAGDGAAAAEARFSDSGPINPPSGIQQQRRPEPQIEFLCPNGHRLHGPAHLQGKPGECPDCGARFRIPVYDDLDEEERDEAAEEREISLGGVTPQEPEEQVELEAEPAEEPVVVAPAATETGPADPKRGSEPHPLALLFLRLWRRKPADAVAELRLASGETMVVERFSRALSQATHGVFAAKEDGGGTTLAVVAWDAIERVLIRGVKNLPDELVE